MALSEPTPKKGGKRKLSESLPVGHRFKAEFNGLCVVIHDREDMEKLISMGNFGKATLSRNFPEFQRRSPEILRNRVFRNRKCISDGTLSTRKVIVVPDSDSESEISDYFTNLKPEYQMDHSGIRESVNLGLEEAFFLAAALNCLDITHEGRSLGFREAWKVFRQSDKYFVTNYVAYYYFRTKNWIVKSGIKFGGDFLLYKQGPSFFHASYVVIIHVVDDSLRKIHNESRRSMKKICLMGLNRLCETAGKELLICEIIWPSNLDPHQIEHEDLSKFAIKEIIMKRWISSQERQNHDD